MLVPGLILLFCAGFKFSQADYECLCSYAADTPIYVSMDTSSNIIGHMQEFSCKQKVSLSQNGWTAILVNHKIGYVKLTGRMVTQMCQGTPEVVPTTTVTTIVPTTTTTTLAPSSSTPSLKTTTAPSVSTSTVSVQTPVPSMKTTMPVLFTHKPHSTSTTIHTSSMISTVSSNITTSALSSSATSKQFKSTAGSTTPTTTSANPMSRAQTTALPTTNAPITALQTTKAQTTALPTTKTQTTTIPTTKAQTTVLPTTKAPLTTASTTKATTTKATTTKAPFNIFNIFSGLHTCPANVVAAAKHSNGFVQVHAGSCYELVPYWYTWQSAEKNCVSKGGHLVHISNQDEENFILNFLYRHGFDRAVWTGLNDRHHEEYFTWTSGARFSWQNWMPGRKSNFYNHIYEDCVVYVPYTNYAHWDDVDCRQTHPWICRYDGTSGSQTTTLAPIINFLSSLIGRDVK